MSEDQLDEFRARVERIESGVRKKRGPQYDGYGNVIKQKAPPKRALKIWGVIRPFLILYIAFTVFKASYIHGADPEELAQDMARLEAGNGISQLVAKMMTPDYFTKPVGELVANISQYIEKIR